MTPNCSNIRTCAWLVKKDNLTLLNQFKSFSINLIAQHINGMTPIDLDVLIGKTVIRYFRVFEYLQFGFPSCVPGNGKRHGCPPGQ